MITTKRLARIVAISSDIAICYGEDDSIITRCNRDSIAKACTELITVPGTLVIRTVEGYAYLGRINGKYVTWRLIGDEV